MINKNSPESVGHDPLLITDLSPVYYLCDDTPYFGADVGWTDLDFTDDNEDHIEESPFTLPVGLTVNWSIRRWLAARVELIDNLVFVNDSADFHQNLTLAVRLDYRLGVKPKLHWPWNPSRHLK